MAAVFPVAQGLNSMSGVYIPEIWAGKTLVKFYLSTVFGDITNTDYEGEIKNMGDTVHIRTIPDITIRDYSIGMNLTYERPDPTIVDLLIDKGKYYAMAINDVEKIQSDLAYVDKWTDDAGQQLAIKIDEAILGDVYADANSSNAGNSAGAKSGAIKLGASGSPLALDETNILSVIVDCGVVLDEQNIPNTDRWMILPAMQCGKIKKSDLKDASLTGDAQSVLRNGRIGGIDRFTIYMSNNIDTTTDGDYTVFNDMFGHKSAITFASQLVKNESLKNPSDFGDLLRGLQVYGYETIKDESLGHLYAYNG